ncbi:MAG: hypothetical protein H6695_07445 [Deferribacteres bacterium]|nr:hypothetical protein [candidate division KSB1 bacterium]MCB9509998.1 hypothetical protein [Deferribacteres bacterium]
MHRIHSLVFCTFFFLILALLSASAYSQPPKIGKRITLATLTFDDLQEVSGIAASRQNANVVWLHNDSGDRNFIYAFNTRLQHLGSYEIVGAKAGDWEDIAIGPGPQDGQHYLYIGDIGDNDAKHDLHYIYRVLEPRVRADQRPAQIKLYGAQKITFIYPDGKRDAEALMVDPVSKDLYIVSKREAHVHVYRAAYPQLTSQPITLQKVAVLPISWVVAGDISATGNEILLKTYDAIYYWPRLPDKPLWQSFEREAEMLPYFLEPQGEAIAWRADGMGYFTISEVFKGIPAPLYFYPRLSPAK